MDFKGITELIKTMSDSKINNLEIQKDGVSIKLQKYNNDVIYKDNMVNNISGNNKEEQMELKDDNYRNDIIEEKSGDYIDDKYTYMVKSPIVGTFYSSPSPDKEAYVKIGSKIKKGDTLCIVEAMKLMNEVKSEVDGEIIDIYPQDGEMVEYEQEIFKIKIDK